MRALNILVLFAVSLSSSRGSQNSNLTTMAVTGGNANLTVPVNVKNFDRTRGRVDVERDGLIVHSYRYGKDHLRVQSPQYENRTTLRFEGSNLSLVISHVTPNDSGLYTFSIRGNETVHNTVNLTVGAGTKELPWKIVIPCIAAAAVVLAAVVLAAVFAVVYYLKRSGRMAGNCAGLKNCIGRRSRQGAGEHELEELNHHPPQRGENAHDGKVNDLECGNINSNNN